ncbi:hypothetical protein ACFQL8_19570 [Streptomyces goshikiensis]|uniref:hypothetical protein n=1 Tax=Streptomyces goshikiensis TaxID=1942 RepID=UPI0016754213|nr:hypothetical protein [Streptomyces goshikiensis]GHD79596.1 hypothetical protein GCM10010336_61890 [Streptomyces goshikiensis]
MDPITAAALAALAGSLGSEAGRQTWQALTTLVRRPFARATAQDGTMPQISSGELEAASLAGDPADPMRAQALATALGVRAALDGEFRELLDQWWQQAQSAPSAGNVYNNIGGNVESGANVVQSRDVSSLTFNMTRPSAAPDRN